MVSNNLPQMIYYQDTTTNQSFMDMHYILKAKGIKNNKFFLAIYDPGLMGIDPRDPNLSFEWKTRVLRECMINFWYFIREVVRIPVEGGEVGSGVRYKLHRGNLAMNYLFVYNYDMFVELPRQHFKTISAITWYLWTFNFGSSNTKMMFMNKKHDDSKKNLKDLKNLRSTLPDYLRMDSLTSRDGKVIKFPNTVEVLQHPSNGNIINTLPAARSKQQADGAGRGCTMAIQYYDEFGFMPYNDVIYGAAFPAFSRAKQNARANNAPYGMLITTTPGDMTTKEGKYANDMRLNATEWNESYYDNTYEEMEELRNSNKNSTFFHIRYTYQQLGSGEDYFLEMVKGYNKNWSLIRREVLLEWAVMSDNCPFEYEDLEIIDVLNKKEPIYTLFFGKSKQYQLHIWNKMDISNMNLYPPIIGVDVSGAMQSDSSAITIIDSKTTNVIATLNCNYIPSDELAQVVYDIVTKYMPNAIVNVERNGGFGASVLGILVKSSIKRNLYFEIKDRTLEDVYDITGRRNKRKQKVKCYGTDNTSTVRNNLIEVLHNRVKNHKDKFAAPILHSELSTMVVKKNGKTEHGDGYHDDQIFSYLMALYVWYFGENLVENFKIRKVELLNDENVAEGVYSLEEKYESLYVDIDDVFEEYRDSFIQEEVDAFTKSSKSISISDLNKVIVEEDNKALSNIMKTKAGRDAVARAYNIPQEELQEYNNVACDITNDINSSFYGNSDESEYSIYTGNMSNMYKNLK